MSISLPSDIVLGVANAADPQDYRAAVERLAQAKSEALAREDAALKAANEAAVANPPIKPAPSVTGPEIIQAKSGPLPVKRSDEKAYQEFEAFFLQTFVDAVLPKDAESLFGSGPAGKIWKSMLAEHLANELAKSTAFGIADKIAEDRREKKAALAPAADKASEKAVGLDGAQTGYLSDLQKLLSVDRGQLALESPRERRSPSFTRG